MRLTPALPCRHSRWSEPDSCWLTAECPRQDSNLRIRLRRPLRTPTTLLVKGLCHVGRLGCVHGWSTATQRPSARAIPSTHRRPRHTSWISRRGPAERAPLLPLASFRSGKAVVVGDLIVGLPSSLNKELIRIASSSTRRDCRASHCARSVSGSGNGNRRGQSLLWRLAQFYALSSPACISRPMPWPGLGGRNFDMYLVQPWRIPLGSDTCAGTASRAGQVWKRAVIEWGRVRSVLGSRSFRCR